MSENDASWRGLVGEILARRQDKDYRKTLANLRKGCSKQTEVYAYPYVLPYTENISEQALLRGVGLLATFSDIPQAEKIKDKYYPSLGQTLALVSQILANNRGAHPQIDKPDAVAQRLMFMSNLDLEAAVLTLRSLLQFVKKANLSVDWYQLIRLLLYWGKGISVETQDFRNSVLRDYYKNIQGSSNSDDKPKGEKN